MKFVSVDGGATKTLAMCYSDDGSILGVGASGPSNFRNVGVNEAKKNLTIAIDRSIERAGLERGEILEYSFALAGVKDSKKSTETIESFIGSMGLNRKVTILNDGEAGFNCRFPGRDGIIAAPGTGMIAYGRRGRTFERASGWGWFLGDEGGAFYIGRRSLQESTKYFDGRLETESKIPDSALDYFGISEPLQIVNEVYTNPMNVRKIAGFARIISDYAGRNDPLAISILKEAARESATCVMALKKRIFQDMAVEFSGYGGVYRAGDLYSKTLEEQVQTVFPDMKFLPPLFGYHAVIGSVYLILHSNGKDSSFDLNDMVKSLDREIGKISENEKREYLFL